MTIFKCPRCIDGNKLHTAQPWRGSAERIGFCIHHRTKERPVSQEAVVAKPVLRLKPLVHVRRG